MSEIQKPPTNRHPARWPADADREAAEAGEMTTDTYVHTCRCGTRSPGFSTREERRRWVVRHREKCPRRATRARTPLDWREVDALVARARAHKPIPGASASAVVIRGEPKRVDLDNWGKSLGGGVRWTGTNCLRACLANLLGAAKLERVPDPTPLFASHGGGWLDAYSDKLAKATGYRIAEEPAVVCFDNRNAGRRWIAAIYEPDQAANHAIVCRGGFVLHDPAGLYGAIPRDRVMFGMRLVPTRRAVPVLSLRGMR